LQKRGRQFASSDGVKGGTGGKSMRPNNRGTLSYEKVLREDRGTIKGEGRWLARGEKGAGGVTTWKSSRKKKGQGIDFPVREEKFVSERVKWRNGKQVLPLYGCELDCKKGE